MAGRLVEQLVMVLVHMMVGAFMFSLFAVAVLRRLGDPRAAGRRAGVYLAAGLLLVAGYVSAVIVLPLWRVFAG